MKKIIEAQIGKKGLTEEFIIDIKSKFEKTQNVRISILKSAGRDKEEIKKMTKEILYRLGKNYTAKNIGFKIAIKKWRKERIET